MCSTSLEGQTFFSKKDKPLCKKHAHTVQFWSQSKLWLYECLWEEIYLLQLPSSWEQKLLPWIRLGFMFSVALWVFLSEYIMWCSVLLRLTCRRLSCVIFRMHLKSRASVLIYIGHAWDPCECWSVPLQYIQLSLCWYNFYLLRRDGRFRGLCTYLTFRAVIFNVLGVISVLLSVSGVWDVWLSLWLYLY